VLFNNIIGKGILMISIFGVNKMKKVVVFLDVLIVMLVCIAFPLFALSMEGTDTKSEADKRLEDDFVIATVNGNPIKYKDIAVSEGSYDDPIQVENGFLALKIHNIIVNEAVSEYGISVSDKEVQMELDRRFQMSGIDTEMADKISKKYKIIYKALVEWQKNKDNSDKIFQEIVSTSPLPVSIQTWEVTQKCYDTPEKLEGLKKNIPENLDDMIANSYQSTRQDVVIDKLRDKVAGDVTVTDEEVLSHLHYRKEEGSEKSDYESKKDMIKEILLRKKRTAKYIIWFSKRTQEAEIKINHEKYEAVFDQLNKFSK
jgi:hypothetical protein